MTVKTDLKRLISIVRPKKLHKTFETRGREYWPIALLLTLILRLNDGDLGSCHWTDLAVNPVIHYVVIIKLKKHLYSGWIQRLVCVSTGIFAFRIDMEPLTRVCTPACGQPNGGRASVPSGYTLVLSTSIHYSKISFCRNLRTIWAFIIYLTLRQ